VGAPRAAGRGGAAWNIPIRKLRLEN